MNRAATGAATPLWQLGFRPFFLLALLSAVGLMAVWLRLFLADASAVTYLDPVLWHGHEMVFGFVVAVVLGFVFTASQSWTGIPGIKGARLMLLAGLWLAARLLMLVPSAPKALVATVDLALLPLAIAFLAPYLGQSSQKKNAVFLILLALLAAGNLAVHLGALGAWPGHERQGLQFGLSVIVMMIAIIAGRVVPFFTSRVLPGYAPRAGLVDRVAIFGVAAFAVAQVFGAAAPVTAAIALAAGAANLWRLIGWLDRRVWKIPVLWILYVGYAWLCAGLFLAAIAALGAIPASAATHALTAGAIGTMIVGMVSRVSLGHTGRPIQPGRLTVASYHCVTAAAALRVFAPLLAPDRYVLAIEAAGGLWILAFTLLSVAYFPILTAPRVDGKPG